MNKYFIAGFIAGEGCFAIYKGHKDGISCYFVVETNIRDKKMLEDIQQLFGYGKVVSYPGRPNICRYQISGVKNCRKLVIPFMDEFLIGSYKKDQYEKWRTEVIAFKFKGELSTPQHLRNSVELVK